MILSAAKPMKPDSQTSPEVIPPTNGGTSFSFDPTLFVVVLVYVALSWR